VIGAELSGARSEVKAVGLDVEVVQEPAPGTHPKRVIDEEPPGGTEVAPGTTVQLVTGK
jgi:beta-lactam-binding protein with PASTA domain